MLTPQDWAATERIVQEAMKSAEFINKVWIAGAAVVVSVFAALVGSVTQIWVARWQRKVQQKLADQQSVQQKQALADQLSMQELASRRVANANVSSKRQVWIDELRKDVAKYLTLWQEISYRWYSIVSEPRSEPISDEALQAFKQPIVEMRKEALELHLLVELRLNMTEAKHQDLNRLMKELEESTVLYQRTVSSLPPETIQAKFQLIRQAVIVKAQEILKEEWERVKKESYVDPNDAAYARSTLDTPARSMRKAG